MKRGGADRPPSMYRQILQGQDLSSQQVIAGSQQLLMLIDIVGVLGIVLFSLQFTGGRTKVSVAGTALLTAGAASLLGGLVGFLFGLPHSGQTTDPNTGSGSSPSRINTNLDQVSDWLTKLLLGVGLVQLGRAPRALGRLATNLARGLGDIPGVSGQFGLALVFYFGICGFLMGYVWARLVLSKTLIDDGRPGAATEHTSGAGGSGDAAATVIHNGEGAPAKDPKASTILGAPSGVVG
jgi:hypothetical protein